MPRKGDFAGPEIDEEQKAIGALFGRLIDDGRAYAEAEFDLACARAEREVKRAKLPVILGLGAIAFGLAGVIALVMTWVLTLSALLGPLVGGLLATLVALGIAGGLGMVAVRNWKSKR